MESALLTSWREILNKLRVDTVDHAFWSSYLEDDANPYTFHLAILVEPFLTYILEGKKTVESRFSAIPCPPYGRVNKGDVILLKQSGGPINAISLVTSVWSYKLDPASWTEVKQFSDALCAYDSSFWAERENASYATLMCLSEVSRIGDFRIPKHDRRGWVVLHDSNEIPY